MENRAFLAARQRKIDVAPSHGRTIDREPAMAPGKRALTDQLHAAHLGGPDHYNVAIESAEREINAIRSVALPALVAAHRKPGVDSLTREIEISRAAMRVRHLVLTANAHVYALEKAATHKDPVILYLRAELDKQVMRATKLGAYRGAEEMIPQAYVEPKPKPAKSNTQKLQSSKTPAPAANKSTLSPTTSAKITKPSSATHNASATMRTRFASGTRVPMPMATRTVAAVRAPIQRKATGNATHANIHAVAARGVESASSPLPFASVIQRAFGHHDISNVRAQIGGAAAKASKKLGAKAYATGNLIAFAHDPDLHTAAHEAAHVIQQQRGVSLVDGVDGGPIDAYERHADEVADAVVAGRSVEHMFEAHGFSASAPTVQRKTDGNGQAKLGGFALYLTVHENAVRAAVQTAFAAQSWPDPAAGLTYQPGGERMFARYLAARIARNLGDATAVKKLCYPGTVQHAIDVVGDSKSWEPEFGERLAYTLTISAATALKDRVGPRYLQVVSSEVELPTVEDLHATRSMDALVAQALTQSGVVDVGNVAATKTAQSPAQKASKGPKETVPSRAQLLDVERQIAKQLDLIRAQARRVGLVATLSPAYQTLSKRVVELADGDEAVRAKYAPGISFQHTMLLTLQPRVKQLVDQLAPMLESKLLFSATKRARRDQLMRAAEQYMRAVAVSDSRERATAILDRIIEREKFEKHQALAHEVTSSHSATRGAIRGGQRADHETTVAEEQLERQFAAALIGAKSSPYEVQKAVTLAGEVALRNRMSAVGRSLETLRAAASKAGFSDVSMWRKWLPEIKSLPEIILDVNDHLVDVNRVWEAAKRQNAPVQDDPNAPADWSEWQDRAVGLSEAQRAFSRIAGDQSIGAFIHEAQRKITDQQFLDAINGFAGTVLLTVATGMGAAAVGAGARAAISGESALSRLVGLGADIAINASLNTVTQLAMNDSATSGSGGWAMLENTLMEVFTRGLMSRVEKLQAAAMNEARAYATLPNLSAAERHAFTNMQFTGLDLTAQMLGGIATQWAAHQLTDLARHHAEKKHGKAKSTEPQGAASEAVASTVYQQGMSIALGKYFHGRVHAWKQHQAELSRTRIGEAPEANALFAAREQFYRDAKALAESTSPDPMAGDWLVQRELELHARERAIVRRLSDAQVTPDAGVTQAMIDGRKIERRVVEKPAHVAERATTQATVLDAATIDKDHSALQQLGSLPPEVMFGAHQQSRVAHALNSMTSGEYAKVSALAAGLPDPIAKGFLYKAVAAGNSVADLRWLAAEMVGKDRGWLIDNLTLGDPRGVGGGVKQQWSTSCNASMTITLRGNYDPVFALRLRFRNMSVGEAHEHDPGAMNMNQADLEKEMLESQYQGSHPGSPKPHQGVAAPRVSQGTGRYADDLLTAQSGATGMTFQSVEHPSGHQVVAVLDQSLASGMQVPLVVGDMASPQAHYVLAQSRREVAGQVEYNIHDPWTGDSMWIKASDIANDSIPGAYHKVGTVEVPSAIPDARNRISSATRNSIQSGTKAQKDGAQPQGSPETTRPMVSKTTDLDTFVRDSSAFVDRIAKTVGPVRASAVRDVELRALLSDAQVEAGLRVMDPAFGKSASRAFKEAARSGDEQTISALESARHHAMQSMLTILRDPRMHIVARRNALVAELTRYENELIAHPKLDRSAIEFAEAKAAALALSENSFANMLAVDDNGALSHAGRPVGTLHELMETVKSANAAYREHKIAREFVIAITQPSDPKVPREVKVISRAPKATMAAHSSKIVEPLDGVDGIVIDIGVGLGSFARDAAKERGPLVQTEYGPKYADAAMTRRDLTWEHAGPRTDVDSVLVLGDTLQTLSMMFLPRSVKRVFINNINAHYSEGSAEYQHMATGLRRVMAEGGRVEVQWTDDLETTGGKTSSRGHITGTELAKALEQTAVAVPRKVSVGEAAPVTDFNYSVEAPRTMSGIPSKAKPTDPIPRYRSVFTFGE